MSDKTLDTLVQDMNDVLIKAVNGEGIQFTDAELETFGHDIMDAIRHWAAPREQSTGLRMSNIGHPNRKLWYDIKNDLKEQSFKPHDAMKFLFGHIIEELVLLIVRKSGHKVENEQKEIQVSGVTGHMDCTIDGKVVDVKSASPFAFTKFVTGKVAQEDPFGYMAQLAGYEHAMGTDGGGFLVMNKVTGELTLFQPDFTDLPNIEDRIAEVRAELEEQAPPTFCYPLVELDNGNKKLSRDCIFCPHKIDCYSEMGVRVFRYSQGPEFLVGEVKSLPRVEEITDEYAPS
jgi:hypothetical protein